ncbi:helix-turn-helix domain-containing protein [Lentilactobacillus farraginis]|nr:XRE family transcriptional regulator [Lentilactobacillus farraginis]GAF35641.1 transcriptional regulator [Lentilactobacillus farraginis DSM 18382 = JCM 14108]
MDIGAIVSANLKHIRSEKGFSLTKLSELSGVSKGMLSQIENNGTSPTINTIWKICAGLNVPYTALLEGRVEVSRVIRRSETNQQKSADGHYRIYGYYPDSAHRNFELFQMELDQGDDYKSTGHSKVNHTGHSEEYVMVLAGQLTLEVTGEKLILNKDDATRFDSTGNHTYRNTGTGILKTVIINFYPV